MAGRSGARGGAVVWGLLLVIGLLPASLLFTANAATAICLPSVQIFAPNGGEDFTGGTWRTIDWTVTPCGPGFVFKEVLLKYQATGTSPWIQIARDAWPMLSLWDHTNYRVPADDTSDAALRIEYTETETASMTDTTGTAVTYLPFTVDSTAPSAAWALNSPSVDVPVPSGGTLRFISSLDASLQFSESMNRTSVESGLNVTVERFNETTWVSEGTQWLTLPDFFLSWDPAFTALRLLHQGTLPPFANVTMSLATFSDDSDPGILGAPASMTVMTEPSNDAPTVAVVAPVGGELWTGGTLRSIDFTIADDRRNPFIDEPLQVTVAYSPAIGSDTIFSGPLPAGIHSVPWIIPAVTFPSYVVRVTATDSGSLVTGNPRSTVAASPAFAIDANPPYVTVATPSNLATDVALTAPILLTFSELMDEAAVEAAFQISGGVTGLVYSWPTPQRTLQVDHDPLTTLTQYVWSLDCALVDRSDPGNPLFPCPLVAFTTVNSAPGPAFVSPLSSAVWSGGVAHDVAWTMTDANTPTSLLTATLEYRLDGGGWFPADAGTGLLAAIPVTPCSDGASLDYRLTVSDPEGMTASATSVAVTVDCASPAIVSHLPVDGALDVDPAAPIQLLLSEPMDLATLAGCFGLSPDPGNVSVSWSPDGRTVTLTPPTLALGVTYTVSVCASAEDLSDPGLPLGGYSFSFTTLPPPPEPPPDPLSFGDLPIDAVNSADPVVVTFPPNVTSADLGSALFVPDATGLVLSWTYTGNSSVLSIDHDALTPCRDYTLTLNDPSGAPTWTRVFRTRCGPAVTVAVLDAPRYLRGGSTVLIQWNVTDDDSPEVTLRLNYSTVGGSDGFLGFVFEGLTATGERGVFWTVPREDTLNLVLRLEAVDAEGNAGANVSATLAVDATPPTPVIFREGILEKGATVSFNGTFSSDNLSPIARYRWRLWRPDGTFLDDRPDVGFTHTFAENGEVLATLDVWDEAGNRGTYTERFTIGATAGAGDGGVTTATIAGGSLLGLLALAAGAVATSEPVRNGFVRHLIVPLYSRLKPEMVSNQATRYQILGYIKGNPGDSYSHIKKILDLNVGALTYHLDVLEREKLIQSQNDGSKRRYYPVGVPMPENGGGMNELQRRIVKIVEEQKETGIVVRDLAGVLGVGRELTYYHVRALNRLGLVVIHRKAIRMWVFPQSASAGSRLTSWPALAADRGKGPELVPAVAQEPSPPIPGVEALTASAGEPGGTDGVPSDGET